MSWYRDKIPDNYEVIRDNVYLENGKNLITDNAKIGKFTYIGNNARIGGRFVVEIGAFCAIAKSFYCYSFESHQMGFITTYPLKTILGVNLSYPEVKTFDEPVIKVGNDVWIGEGVKIREGVKVGDGVIIGTRALVTKKCEPYGIYGGVPAKLIKLRFSENIISQLLEIKWWDWDVEKIIKNHKFFSINLTTFKGNLKDLIIE